MRTDRRRAAVVCASVVFAFGPAVAGCARSGDAWRFETKRPFFAGDSQAFTPILQGDTIFFCGGYSYNDSAELVALRVGDGRLLWRSRVGSCSAPPVVAGSTIVVSTGRNQVFYGIDAASGHQSWRKDLHDATFRGAVGDFIYLTRPERVGGGLERLDARTGRVERVTLEPANRGRLWLCTAGDDVLVGDGPDLWRIDASAPNPRHVATLHGVSAVWTATSDGQVLLLEDRDNHLTAFDVASGEMRWSRKWPRILSAPAIAEDKVFVNTFGSNRYQLEALDAATGGRRWVLDDGGFEPPTVVGKELYAAGQKGAWILDATNGAISRRIESSREIITSPIRVGNLLVFGTIDGSLRAINLGGTR